MQPSRRSIDRTSPLEQFTGLKIDFARYLRVQFADYAQATVTDTDNTMHSRTQECSALLPTGNFTGSVKMWCLSAKTTITRDQFKILPMPDLVVTHITSLAALEGFTRGIDPDVDPLETDTDDGDMLPNIMAIGSRGRAVQLADHNAMAPDAGVYDDKVVEGCEQLNDQSNGMNGDILKDNGAPAIAGKYPPALALVPTPSQTQYLPAKRHGRGVDSLQSLQNNISGSSTITISVTAALKDRHDEATPVIMNELKQMQDNYGVQTQYLIKTQRSAIIKSSMFMKDKYLAHWSRRLHET